MAFSPKKEYAAIQSDPEAVARWVKENEARLRKSTWRKPDPVARLLYGEPEGQTETIQEVAAEDKADLGSTEAVEQASNETGTSSIVTMAPVVDTDSRLPALIYQAVPRRDGLKSGILTRALAGIVIGALVGLAVRR